MARSLLGRRLDDEVVVKSPAGERRLYITEIDYPAVDSASA